MAAVFRFPDRSAAESGDAKSRHARLQQAGSGPLRSAKILILPCIRREPLDRSSVVVRQAEMPAQLQA